METGPAAGSKRSRDKYNITLVEIKDHIGKYRALSREVMCYFRLYLYIGRTRVYTQEYPIPLPTVGIYPLSRLLFTYSIQLIED